MVEFHNKRNLRKGVFSSPKIGREIYWEGTGVDEVAKEKETGIVRVKINPKYYRPAEVVSIVFVCFFDEIL